MPLSFAHPSYLWAWGFVIIPILLHLFYWKRYKTVYFSHVAALWQAQEQHKRHQKLRRRLILACRIAAIVLLVAAFARPQWHGLRRQEAAVLHKPYQVLYIDNSYSMSAPYAGGATLGKTALAAAIDTALHLMRHLAESETVGFYILTNDFEQTPAQFLSLEEARHILSQIRFSPASRSLQEIEARIAAVAEEQGLACNSVGRIYLSDAALESQSENAALEPEPPTAYITLTPPPYDDWRIDSAALSQAVSPASGEGELMVWVSRSGVGASAASASVGATAAKAERRLQCVLDGQPLSSRRVVLSPGERTHETWRLRLSTPGYHAGTLHLEADTVPFNNQLYLSLYRPSRHRVLHVFDGDKPSEAVRRLFGGDSAYIYEAVSLQHLSLSALSSADFVLAEGWTSYPPAWTSRLGDYLRQGGRVAVAPAPGFDNGRHGADAKAETAPQALNAWLQHLLGRPIYGAYHTYAPQPKRLIVGAECRRHPVWQKAWLGRGSDVANTGTNALTPQGEAASEPLLIHQAYTLNHHPQDAPPLWPEFIADFAVGSGRLYLLSAPLDENSSSFATHYGFVVCMLGMAEAGGGVKPLYVADRRYGATLTAAQIAQVAKGSNGQAASKSRPVLHLRPCSGQAAATTAAPTAAQADTLLIRPSMAASPSGEIRLYGLETLPFGHYRVENEAGQLIDLLALNPPQSESSQPTVGTRPVAPTEVQATVQVVPTAAATLAQASSQAATASADNPQPSTQAQDTASSPSLKTVNYSPSSSVPLWKILLIFALLFVGAEMILLSPLSERL